jgi:S1-C subfamily serine protease
MAEEVSGISRSLVSFVAGDRGQRWWGDAVAMDGSGYLVAAVTRLKGRDRVLVDAGGRVVEGVVAAVDRQTGLSVIEAPLRIPPATVGAFPPARGQVVFLLCRVGPSGRLAVYSGRVQVPDGRLAAGGTVLLSVSVVDVVPKACGSDAVVVDAEGRLVGLSVPVSGLRQGSVVASPVMAADLIEASKKGKELGEAWLGVECKPMAPADDIDDSLLELMTRGGAGGEAGADSRGGFARPAGQQGAPARGVEVREVYPGSPAAEAGIQPGDVIVALNGSPVESLNDMQSLIHVMYPGQVLEVEIARNSSIETLQVRLSSRNGDLY